MENAQRKHCVVIQKKQRNKEHNYDEQYKICKLHKTPFPTKKPIEQESYCNCDFWRLRGRIRAEAEGLLLLCFLKNDCFATFSPQSWKTIKLTNLYCNWDFWRLWERFRAGLGIPNTIQNLKFAPNTFSNQKTNSTRIVL